MLKGYISNISGTANDTKVKLSEDVGVFVEQNQNALYVYKLSKGHISNISGTIMGNKLNLYGLQLVL